MLAHPHAFDDGVQSGCEGRCPSALVHGYVITYRAVVGVGCPGVIRSVARRVLTGSDSEHRPEGRVGAAV